MIYGGVSDEYIQPTNWNHSDSKEQKVKNSEDFLYHLVTVIDGDVEGDLWTFWIEYRLRRSTWSV